MDATQTGAPAPEGGATPEVDYLANAVAIARGTQPETAAAPPPLPEPPAPPPEAPPPAVDADAVREWQQRYEAEVQRAQQAAAEAAAIQARLQLLDVDPVHGLVEHLTRDGKPPSKEDLEQLATDLYYWAQGEKAPPDARVRLMERRLRQRDAIEQRKAAEAKAAEERARAEEQTTRQQHEAMARARAEVTHAAAQLGPDMKYARVLRDASPESFADAAIGVAREMYQRTQRVPTHAEIFGELNRRTEAQLSPFRALFAPPAEMVPPTAQPAPTAGTVAPGGAGGPRTITASMTATTQPPRTPEQIYAEGGPEALRRYAVELAAGRAK